MKRLLRNIFSIVVLIVEIFAVYEILKLNILPNKYLIIFLSLEILLYLIGVLLYNLKHKLLIVIGVLLLLINISGNVTGYYYLSKTNNYIEKSFPKETYKIETKYYVVASANDSVNELSDLNEDTTIEYYKYSRSIDKALKKLGNFNYKSTDNASDEMYKVRNEYAYFLISTANYDYFFGSTNLLQEDEFKIIHEYVVEEEIPVNRETPDVYNVYINGLDFTGIMRDYNLIATVNTKTRKVVLTSIPRDYYIDVPAYNMKDTLMCLGSLDSEVSKEALENLFGIKIDYTINLNTYSLVDVVDKLGGIQFCSDYEFTTSHALITGSYDDSKGPKLHVTRGCKNYNGIQILAIARERMALPGRDRYRQKNCRQILINILKKTASSMTLTNYNEILSTFDGVYTTDMNEKTIKKLIKTVIEDTNFEIIEQSVDGTDGIGIGHLGTQESWIMTPGQDTVDAASSKIKEVLNEK